MKTTNMNFGEALAAMERGERVRRSGWSENSYIFLSSEQDIFLYGTNAKWNMTYHEIKATDWEIYNPEPVLNPCGCGLLQKPYVKNHDGKFYVRCGCGVRTDACDTQEEAIEIWNAAHPVAKPKPRTNFEKWATVGNLSDIVSHIDFDCTMCPAWNMCDGKCHKCSECFYAWANATAEEEQK